VRLAWEIPGADQRREHPSLHDALKRLHEGRRGPATDDDRPPISTFPITAAARAALRYSKEQ